jgi:leucyl/phenylalanyl-tRNA--protein transferase
MDFKSLNIDITLQPFNMIRLYASGAFPMDDGNGNINWYLPSKRAIIPLDNFNIPRSAKKLIVKNNFEIKFDTDYLGVIKGCANRKETWISEKLIIAYKKLHKLGFVHSVETYYKDKLVGGLYGITFRGAFFGESMFSEIPGASKAALISLIKHLKERNFILLDVQYLTDHFKMFGAVEIEWDEYDELLKKSYISNTTFI